MSDCTIRFFLPSDLDAVVAIYNMAVREGFKTGDLEEISGSEKQRWLQKHDPQHPVLVAASGGTICGWLSLSPYRKGRQAFSKVREVSYYVHPDFRKRKVATALLSAAFELAPEKEIEHLIALVLDKNRESISFLEKHGFRLWGRMPGLAEISGERIDHLYYGKTL